MNDRLILWEQPEGIPWIVAHWPARKAIVATPAPPEWASPELRSAVEGSLLASVEGFCVRCEAVRPAASDDDEAAPKVPHAPWCERSEETIRRLQEACRPPAVRWLPDDSPETVEALRNYIDALRERLDGDETVSE